MTEKQGEQLESIWGRPLLIGWSGEAFMRWYYFSRGEKHSRNNVTHSWNQKDTKWGSYIKSKEEVKAYDETEEVGVNYGRIQKLEEGVCILKYWEII